MKKKKIKLHNTNFFKSSLLKSKIKGFKNKAGRNSDGRITIRHRGSGHKRKMRLIKFSRDFPSVGIVLSIEYDPNRTSLIACVFDLMRSYYYYILAPKNLLVGDLIGSGNYGELSLGNALKLSKIPVGTALHNISLHPTNKGIISRSAGTSSILIQKNDTKATLKVSSGKVLTLPVSRVATIGVVSNENHFLNVVGKAGRSRWLNKRPTVRGVAMNPVDHPHGGGEGKTSGGKIQVTPWGKPTKNYKTRKIIKKLK